MTTKQKTKVNKLIRVALRVPAYATLMIILVMRIVSPVLKDKPIYLQVNDGYVIFGCLALLLGIEGVRVAIDSYVRNKTSK